MKRMPILPWALALLSGCGVSTYHPAPHPPAGGPYQPGPGTGGGTGVGATDIPAFLIDAGAGVDLPEAAYAVTTNGMDWTLAWRGDASLRQFDGEVIGAGTFSEVRFANGFAGDRVEQVERARVRFSADTDGGTIQSITLRSDTQPVRFQLLIDGYAAINAVVFSFAGTLSTTDAMPFDLVTEDQLVRIEDRVTAAKPIKEVREGAAAQSAQPGRFFVPAPGAAAEDRTRSW